MEAVIRLQQREPEKLIELCRMHLTFTLDLHNDEFSALIDIKNDRKKIKSYFHRRVKDKHIPTCAPLTQECISHIYQIIEYLGRETNVKKEGLFRKTGSLSRQNELKALLNIGADIDFSSGIYNVHDCACVLKSFLAALPEPLLSEAHYSAHSKITDMNKECMSPRQKKAIFLRQLKSTKLLLLLLPQPNYCLLKYLLLLLNQIQNAREENKMTATNLATLFAPHIICPRKMLPESLKKNFAHMIQCVTFLIENATLLFDPPKELVQDVLLYLKDLPIEGKLESSTLANDAVKTVVAFCDRNECDSADYTNKALSELQSYIQNLPNSARKRKLMKKFQKENVESAAESAANEPRRKHFRSRSVGEAIKKRLWKNATKRDDFRCSTIDMMSTGSCSTDSIPAMTSKASSLEALHFNNKEKLSALSKNLLRASKKHRAQKAN